MKNQKRDYSYCFASVMHHAMTQVYLKRGLKKLKEKRENAVSKEFLQIHMNIKLKPLTAGDITDRDKYEAL